MKSTFRFTELPYFHHHMRNIITNLYICNTHTVILVSNRTILTIEMENEQEKVEPDNILVVHPDYVIDDM